MTWLIAILLVVLAAPVRADTCGLEAPCPVAGGTYRVSPPPGPPPHLAALFLHGYQGSGDDEMGDDDLRAPFARAGILLVLPNGAGRTWAMPGTPGPARDDRAFIAAIVADVARRWPIDVGKMWLGGMSQGASMVWDIACHAGGFSAYVAIAGDFWDPLPAGCEAGPVNLLQIHGLTDPVFPLEGRAIGSSHQGDVFAGLAVLRKRDGCRSNPDTLEVAGIFVLRAWTQCASGAQLRMLLHTGDHEIPAGWFEAAWPWVQAVSPVR